MIFWAQVALDRTWLLVITNDLGDWITAPSLSIQRPRCLKSSSRNKTKEQKANMGLQVIKQGIRNY